jgi:hypothetical protein
MDKHSEHPDHKPKKKRGFSLLTTIVILTLILLIIGGYLVFSSQNYKKLASQRVDPPIDSIAANDPTTNPDIETELKQAVTSFLSAIQKKDPQTAYDFTTKEFKTTTTPDQFLQFVKNTPIVTEFKTIVLAANYIEQGSYGEVKAFLGDDSRSANIQFVLIKENNRWKIYGFRFLNTEQAEPEKPKAKPVKTQADLNAIIDAQLTALHNKDSATAYYAFTSKEFQKILSYDHFKVMLEKFPALTDYTSYKINRSQSEGTEAAADVVLNQEDKETRLKYTFIQEDKRWKILSMRPMRAYSTPETAFTPEMQQEAVKLITAQLNDIKANDATKAYYAYSSRDLQESTPVETFKAFIGALPIFTNYTDISFDQGHNQEKLGIINVTLRDKSSSEITLEYLLIIENDKLKIFSMEVRPKQETPEKQARTTGNPSSSEIADAAGDTNSDHTPPYFNSDDLQIVIDNYLKAIRNQDLSKAYYGYTSKEFQESTSYKEFEEFLQNHPQLLKNDGAYFSKFHIEDDVGNFEGDLKTSDESKQKIRVRLLLQDGKWKILSIDLLTPQESSIANTEPNTKSLDFPKLTIGTQVNPDGVLTNGIATGPYTAIPQNENQLYANLYITNAKAGTDIAVVLEHLNSGSKVPAAETKVDLNIDSATASFSFSPPPQGWPKGNYQFHVTTSTGISKNFPFSIK